MKVLMINVTCGIGSTGRICTDVALELEKQGHEVKIAYGRDCDLEKYSKYAVKIGTSIDVKLHALFARIFDSSGFGSKSATRKFIKWVEEYNPDVIHLHNIHGYYINVEILFDYLKKSNKKIVWTLHDCWAFTGHCAHFSFVNCYKWKKQCCNCLQKSVYPSSLVFSSAKRNYNKKKIAFTGVKNLSIITPSKWLAALTKESFLKEYPTTVINNGIDIGVFRNTESDILTKYGISDKKIVLGVANNWGERKGFDDFIELSKKLPDEYKIVMIGLTLQQMKDIPNNIFGIEKTSSVDELVAWYSAADVFVNTTYEDTFPTVNLEAQACGTPVITYKTGGSTESVPPENVVEQGDLNALENRIKLFCEQDYKNKFVCDSAKYDRAVFFRKYVQLYDLE